MERSATLSATTAVPSSSMATNMDYDKFLGICHSVLVNRIVGRNVVDEQTRKYKFTFKRAFLEELDTHFWKLARRKDTRCSQGMGDEKHVECLEGAYFMLEAALRRLIHPGAFYQSTESFRQKNWKGGHSNSRKKRIYDLGLERNNRRSRLLTDGVEVWEMITVATKKAWGVFMEVNKDWDTLGVLSVSFAEFAAKETHFEDFLECIKILIPCAYFREFEQVQLKLDRVYPAEAPFTMDCEQLLMRIMSSPFIREARKLLKQQDPKSFFGGTSMLLRRKGPRGKKIRDLDQVKIADPLKICLTIDRITKAFLTWRQGGADYFEQFSMQNHPSVFQEKVSREEVKPAKAKRSNASQCMSEAKDGELERIALITEDADTALLTMSSSRRVNLYDTQSAMTIGVIDVTKEKVSAFTSNRSWFVFGTESGHLLIYKIHLEQYNPASKDCRPLATEMVLSQDLSISTMILNSHDDRLFTGCSKGRIVVWDLTQEQPTKNHLHADDSLKLHPVTCLCTDERTTMTRRYAPKLLFSGHSDGTVCVWNILEKRRSFFLWSFSAHSAEITALVVKDKELVTGGQDKMMKVWRHVDASAAERKISADAEIMLNAPVTAIVIDYEVIICASDNALHFYERTGFAFVEKLLLPTYTDKKYDVPIISMTIDRRRRLYTVDTVIRIWELENLLHGVDLKKANNVNRIKLRLTNRNRQAQSTFIDDEQEISLQTTMKEILDDINSRRLFNNFLVDSYAEESLHFWILVESYEYFAETCGGEALTKFGREIIAEHVLPDSPHPINISHEVRKALVDLEETDFSRTTFKDAKESILKLMEQNFRYKFLSTIVKQRKPKRKAKSGGVKLF